VAQKTVATFNSTGTPALFMHAADALHGDLGMIGTGDPVICLSKSGNTPEIQALTPLLRQRGNPIIAVTAHADSALASAATVLLLLPVAQEADPLNLAPTTSTTLQMALGDALATALIARRGFTASDFARFHPGGSLGRKLYLTVGDLARLHDQPQVGIHDKLPAVILRITSGRLGATAVLDANNQLCGIVTDGDLRRALEKFGAQAYALQASEVMTPYIK
jgi:arabinose-5-phosphate isomerase